MEMPLESIEIELKLENLTNLSGILREIEDSIEDPLLDAINLMKIG